MAAPAHRPARRDRVPLLSFAAWGTLRFGRRCRTWRKRPRGLRATLARKGSQSKSSPTRLQTDSQTMSRRGSHTNPPRRRVHQSQRPGRHGQLLPGGFVYLHPFNSARGWAEGRKRSFILRHAEAVANGWPVSSNKVCESWTGEPGRENGQLRRTAQYAHAGRIDRNRIHIQPQRRTVHELP